MSAEEQGPTTRPFWESIQLNEIFVLEGLGIRVRLRALADGGRRLVHPHPAANAKFGDWTQCVGEGGVAAVHASNGEGVVFTNDIVRALLVVRRRVAIGEVVAGPTLVAGDSSTLENP